MTSIPPPEYIPRVTDTLKTTKTVTSQPKTTVLTAQQKQALAQIAAQQQSLTASQQTNVQVEHTDQTGGTNQIGVNQFKTSWCCPTSVCGCTVNCIPIFDYCCLTCIVAEIAGKVRLGNKSGSFWCMALLCCILFVIGGSLALMFLSIPNFNDPDSFMFLVFNLPMLVLVPTMVVACLLRGKLRKIRNIEGSKCGDCCLIMLCTQGAVAQMWWEINSAFIRS